MSNNIKTILQTMKASAASAMPPPSAPPSQNPWGAGGSIKIIGNTMRLQRKALRLTQKDVARAARIGASTVSYAERGMSNQLATFSRIAQALDGNIIFVPNSQKQP